jgi:type II secretory pathway pseudopilin PulG
MKIENLKLKIKNNYLSRGQTMLEILIALTLIMFFLSGVVIIQLNSIKNIKYAQIKSVATTLARQHLERARVLRDTYGMNSIIGNDANPCGFNNPHYDPCYINEELTPGAVAPTGSIYHESLEFIGASDTECPIPTNAPPNPTIYKVVSRARWVTPGVAITPDPEVNLTTCFSDWR